ncbi:hypothetical protein BST63_27380 [Bradyrhizobium canariense]|uniref:DUF4166 domain-containing protein n=2 Tax=Bradyrhizobium canariense TaxID=255045 RepID=A0ABX3WX44_9BRAD|nr:hypothetical protein BSR47_35750 [Bradyrhizobium canariense]OSJ24264.1 hypothetical protein BST63_27380 [Bradyrhizobium canariense]
MRLTGLRPLLMHSGRLCDPLDPVVRDLARLTSKRLKTVADHQEIARVEWFGGLWLDGGIPCIPAEALEATFLSGARMQRRGPQAAAGLQVEGPARLFYDGPNDVDELWSHERFRLRVPVRVGTARTMRTRARFDTWNVEFTASFLPSLLSKSLIAEIFTVAGYARGLGDWRPKFGRFQAERLD